MCGETNSMISQWVFSTFSKNSSNLFSLQVKHQLQYISLEILFLSFQIPQQNNMHPKTFFLPFPLFLLFPMLLLPTHSQLPYQCSLSFNTAPWPNSGQCKCQQPPFIWSKKHLSCLKLINCSQVQNANDTSYGVESCKCVDGMRWSEETVGCEVDCVRYGARRVGKRCECAEGELWFEEEGVEGKKIIGCKVCEEYSKRTVGKLAWKDGRCTLNCNKIANSIPTPSGCSCLPGYTFSPISIQCLLNCTLLANTDPNFPTGSQTRCACLPNYTFVNSSCEFGNHTVNCLELGALEAVEDSGCRCRCAEGLQWDKVGMRCRCKELERCECPAGYERVEGDCRRGMGGNGRWRKGLGWVCDEGYYWNVHLEKCVVDCRKLNNSDLSDTDQHGNCHCLDGYSFQNSSCKAINYYFQSQPPHKSLFTLSSRSQTRQFILFRSTLNSLISKLQPCNGYTHRLKQHLNTCLMRLYNNLLFLQRDVPRKIESRWKERCIWRLVREIEALHREIRKEMRSVGLVVVVVGDRNMVAKVEAGSKYVVVVGNGNRVAGAGMLAVGEGMRTGGMRNMLFGKEIQAITDDSIIVGEMSKVMFRKTIVVGQFQIDLDRKKIIRVVENDRDCIVPRLI